MLFHKKIFSSLQHKLQELTSQKYIKSKSKQTQYNIAVNICQVE